MSDKLVEVGMFSSIQEAQLARNLLEAEGIPSRIVDDLANTALWHVGTALGGIKLLVAEEELEKVQRILTDLEQVRDDARPDSEDEHDSAAEDFPDEEDFSDEEDSLEEEERITTQRGLEKKEGVAVVDDRLGALEMSPGEAMANRAFRAAVFGIAIPPLALYAIWLLFQLWQWDGELSNKATAAAFCAMILSVLPVILWTYLILGLR